MRDYILNLRNYAGINGYYNFSRGDQRGLDPLSTGAPRWDSATGTAVPVSRPGGRPL